MNRIVVHIDRLALSGFAPGEQEAIAQGLRAEVARLYAQADRAAPLRSDAARLDAGRLRIAANASGRQIGAQVARNIVKEIGS